MPANVLDLFAEFRWLTNGKKNIDGAGLLSAMAYHGLDGIDAAAKDKIRTAIGTGAWRGVYTKEEILAYCATDVEALTRLLPAMLADIDLPRALHLRGPVYVRRGSHGT
jgi:DNA polymerase I